MKRAMPTEVWERVPGADLAQQAVNLAGSLAEGGVQTLQVREAGVMRELRARVTDLPRELMSGAASIEISGGDIEVRLAGEPATRVLEWRRQC